MRIERNIEFVEGRQLPYQVRVIRETQLITESYATYEEAMKARDEIEANYRETGKLDHSNNYENGKLKLARSRFQSDALRKTKNSSGQTIFVVDTVCKQCNWEQTYQRSDHYHQFLDRGQICQSCFTKNRYNDLLEIRYSNTKANSNNRSTGIKNIVFDKQYSKYRVTIERKKVRVNRFADTLDEAIAIKERILDFWKEFDRLPMRDEV